MAEMERILARFLADQLETLDDHSCHRIMELLQQTDADLLDWLAGIKKPAATIDQEVLGWISRYCQEK